MPPVQQESDTYSREVHINLDKDNRVNVSRGHQHKQSRGLLRIATLELQLGDEQVPLAKIPIIQRDPRQHEQPLPGPVIKRQRHGIQPRQAPKRILPTKHPQRQEHDPPTEVRERRREDIPRLQVQFAEEEVATCRRA